MEKRKMNKWLSGDELIYADGSSRFFAVPRMMDGTYPPVVRIFVQPKLEVMWMTKNTPVDPIIPDIVDFYLWKEYDDYAVYTERGVR